jgi:LysR family transcriptional regulator for metE and metH
MRIAKDSVPEIAPRPLLEVRDLELVLALAAAGSTAGAAGSLHLTQSAVSRALSQAESRVGVELFERSARGLLPTAAGKRLLAGAGPLLVQLHELERTVAAPEQAPLRVRLVCECYTAYRWLPSAMVDMRELWPDLAVEVGTEHTGDPVKGLLRGKIDIALLTTAEVPKGAGLLTEPLFSDEVVFVVSKQHRFARLRNVTPLQLETETLITGNTPTAEGRWFTRNTFGRRRPRLQFMRLPLTEAIMDAARAGIGVAVLSEWMASGYVDQGERELVVRRLASGPLRRPWRIAYREELRNVAARLKGALRGSVPRLRG